MQAGFLAAILDVDGVLVDSPHERAWRDALDELMETSWRSIRDRTTYSPDRFTSQLYHAEMSGKPTMSGAQAVLEHFGVPEAEDRTEQYGKRKQQIVDRILAADGVTAYPDALRFVLAIRDAGILVCAASSSKNAGRLLEQIRLDVFAQDEGLNYEFLRPNLSLLEVFDADVSGRDSRKASLTPKSSSQPPGSSASHRARALSWRRRPRDSSRRSGRDGRALGSARAVDVDVLAAARADLVVTSLDDVSLSALFKGRLIRIASGDAVHRYCM